MSGGIIWFRSDLRLTDNPALRAALTGAETLLALYILEDDPPWPLGAAARSWLHHSLNALDRALRHLGNSLLVMRGDPLEIIPSLCASAGCQAVYWNRRYAPFQIERDKALKTRLQAIGIEAKSFNASLLLEPWEIHKADGGPYRVFTPFWKALQPRLAALSPPLPAPDSLPPPPARPNDRGLPLEAFGLLPRPAWDQGFYPYWRPGEAGALTACRDFIDQGLAEYGSQRDRPDRAGTSRLSPHLCCGEIGPRQVIQAIRASGQDGADYQRQLGWREFAYHLLYHFPHTVEHPLDQRFNLYPWRKEKEAFLSAWQQGRTGIPLIDAGMRELWQRGWMHNRVRMIVASFLSKNLQIHWLEGARWFWDTLVDADLANNSLGWQWSAGCGADAAPYFRLFNPVLQGERFDPEGRYVRLWLPELAGMSTKWIHRPWLAPEEARQGAGIKIGKDYPSPIVDMAASRTEALAAWEGIKNKRIPGPYQE